MDAHFGCASGQPFRNQLAASEFSSIENRFDAAPRVWLGFENDCGWGIRAQYWRYSASDSTYNVNVGPPLLFNMDNIAGDSSLTAYDIDLELTRRVDYRCWDLLESLGVRYGDLQREEKFSAYSTTNNTFVSANSTRNVQGTGLTGGLEARRPLGECGFGLFLSGRGSVLFGNNDAVAIGEIARPAREP